MFDLRHNCRRLAGAGHPPRYSTQPPGAFLDEAYLCGKCGKYKVLKELVPLIGNICWKCHQPHVPLPVSDQPPPVKKKRAVRHSIARGSRK